MTGGEVYWAFRESHLFTAIQLTVDILQSSSIVKACQLVSFFQVFE